jgi:hypothetical protein
VAALSNDGLEQLLTAAESSIAQLRLIQSRAVGEADRRQLPCSEGSRTMREWVSSRIDVTTETAESLERVANTPHRELSDALENGIGFERVALCARADDPDLHLDHDLGRLQRRSARSVPVEAGAELDANARRYLLFRPDLFDVSWRVRGLLPALEGAVVSQVLEQVADDLPDTPGAVAETRQTRMADALAMVCADAAGTGDTADPNVRVVTTVIVDTRNEAGPAAFIPTGPRVGPHTLEQLLCDSSIEVTGVTDDGTPLAHGTASTAIPPRTRRFVLARDDGCVVDGCRSTHRLQPHHMVPRTAVGSNDPANLASLCWYHHHVVIHRRGYRLDPTTPPGRRRFIRPGNDPPEH